jgi:hypothetical protein
MLLVGFAVACSFAPPYADPPDMLDIKPDGEYPPKAPGIIIYV